jgi:predicted transcriptional regulator
MRSTRVPTRKIAACLSLALCLSAIPAYNAVARGAAWQAYASEMSPRESIQAVIGILPGIHFRAIMETVNRTNGVVQYHLRQMELNREVFSINFGHLKGYFPSTMRKLSRKELLTLVAVRHPIRNAIIQALLDEPLTVSEIAALCGEDANKVLFHLQKMAEIGLLIVLDTMPCKYSIAGDSLSVLNRFAFSPTLLATYA